MSTPTSPPNDINYRGAPAGAAGAVGASPQAFVSPDNAPQSGDLPYFLIESARPTTPHVLPVLNLAPLGLEPPLDFTVPALYTAADPRGLPARTAVPGQHMGSTAPKTPGFEVGAHPGAGHITPASAFTPPSEDALRASPSAGSGASGASLHPAVAAAGGTGSQPYFLDEAVRVAALTPAAEPSAKAFAPILVPLPVTDGD